MGKRGRNIRSRKKIQEALEIIDSPFTSTEMATLSGLGVKRVRCLLHELDDIEKIPVNRSYGYRVLYKVI